LSDRRIAALGKQTAI